MADFEVHLDLHGQTRSVGLARSNRVRGSETVLFEYDSEWLKAPDRFSLEPALALTRGPFAPPAGLTTFGSIGDSAPDTWGRRLMQRSERRMAQRDGRAVRTLAESDYLLGVADETRLGEGAGIPEVLQTPGAAHGAWSILDALLSLAGTGTPFIFREPFGQAREVKVALSGLFGRFVARAERMDASCHDDEFQAIALGRSLSGTRFGAMVAAFSHMTIIGAEPTSAIGP